MNPPWTLADALSGCPSSREANEFAKSRSTSASPEAPSDTSASACAATMPVTIAVADEPIPRPCGTSFTQSSRRPRWRLDPQLGPRDRHRPVHEVRPVEGHDAGTLTGDGHDETRGCRDARPTGVPDPERAADRVEAGAEVRAARWHAHLHRDAGPQPRGAHPSRPRATATLKASTGTRTGATSSPSAVRSAHCGSLRPCPVTVHTIVAPAGTMPARCALSSPAMLAAEPGSTKMPSVEDRHALALEDLVVGHQRRCARRTRREPPSAWAQDAGLPMRIAVAIVSGFVDRVPEHDRRGTGGLEAPHPRRARRDGGSSTPPDRRSGVLGVAAPVGRDVPGVADGQDVDVGGVPERVDDLEGRGLLTLDRGRVHRVDELDGVGLGELARDGEAVVEVALDLDEGARRGRRAWLSLPIAILPSGTSTAQVIPALVA